MNPLPPARDLAGARTAHAALETHIAELDDAHARQPSLLPGWTVGHVLTHLARNADSHRRMLIAAERGEVAHQYEGGAAGRAAEIDEGAGRSAADLVADVAASNAMLADVWSSLSEVGWSGIGVAVVGEVGCADLPFRRWRETVVHHADLGLGFTWHDWPTEYVRLELDRMAMLWAARQPMGLTSLPPAALAVDEHHRLAWMLGRASIDGLGHPGLM